MKFQPRRLIKYYYLRFTRLKGDPKSISRGVAIGTFIGITPTIPLHTIALLITAPLCRANLVAGLLASVAFCNPLTYFPQYYLSWLIGNSLTPTDLSWNRIKGVMDIVFSDASYKEMMMSFSTLGVDTAVVLVVGGFILATPFSVATYFLTLRFFINLQKKRTKKTSINCSHP